MIRAGVAADLPAITSVRTAVHENHLSVAQMAAIGITHETIAASMAAGDLGCWVAEHEGVVIGFSMADRKEGQVFALFVDPAHEGKGHGSALLTVSEEWLRQSGHRVARLTTDAETRAFHFYQRRGWTVTGRTAGHFAEDEVLEKSLNAP
jgi:GNAT superfamily N-acetyltransferase